MGAADAGGWRGRPGRRLAAPDLLPSAEDLDEPAGFIDGAVGGDTSGIDEAIAKLEEEGDAGTDS